MTKCGDGPTSSIADVVRRVIADTCGCDVLQIRPDALLFDLTGDDSLLLMDLEFRLGKSLRVPIRLGAPLTIDLATGRGGLLSPHYLRTLRERYPFLAFDRLPADARPSDLPQLLTVDAIIGLVTMQLCERPDTPPGAGQTRSTPVE